MGHLTNKEGFITGFGLVVGNLGSSSRKGFWFGWMLPGTGSNGVVGYLNKSYLVGGRNKARLKL